MFAGGLSISNMSFSTSYFLYIMKVAVIIKAHDMEYKAQVKAYAFSTMATVLYAYDSSGYLNKQMENLKRVQNCEAGNKKHCER